MDMGEAQGRLETAARAVFEIFKAGNLTLCAAESCTGGLVGSSIVGIPRASSIFKGSAVCYCDASKISILGVRRDTIDNCFAESSQCSIEMARGALRIFGADAAVSTTGFLDANVGGKPQELAGKVFVCACVRVDGGKTSEFCSQISLDTNVDRNLNRTITAACALESLRLAISSIHPQI